MNNYITYGERLTDETLVDLREQLRKRGGFTALYNSNNAGRYIVGIKGFTVHMDSLKLRHIDQIVKVAAATVGADGFGAWVGEGIVYLDAIRTEDNKDNALYWARRYDQLAIYDTETDASIYLNLTSG